MTFPLLDNATQFNWDRPLDSPRRDELHLWSWRTDKDHAGRFDLTWLDAGERERHKRFANEEVRQKFLVAHARLRKLLGEYVGCSPSDVALENSSAGKPRLPSGPLRFNLSHSGDVVVVAVSRAEVGVDVERIRPVSSLRALAARHMTSAEQAAIDADTGDERLATFFRLWTRKEAAVKLTGHGLQAAVGLFEVSADLEFAGELAIPNEWQTDLRSCWIANITMSTGYVAAVACEREPGKVICRQC